MGKDHVIDTIYPTLDIAKRNFLGYEEVNEIERLLQRIILQEDVTIDKTSWTDFKELGISQELFKQPVLFNSEHCI